MEWTSVPAIKIANHFELSIVASSCNLSGAKKGTGHEPIFLSVVMDSKQPIQVPG